MVWVNAACDTCDSAFRENQILTSSTCGECTKNPDIMEYKKICGKRKRNPVIMRYKNDQIKKQDLQLEQKNAQLKEQNAHLKQLLLKTSFLSHRFNDKQMDGIIKADTLIIVQGKTDESLYAHKFILASKSPVFCRMFTNKMQEEKTGIIHIDDATLPVMRAVIRFCYDMNLKFTDDVTAEEVLEVAHKYDIELLEKICEAHLMKTINNANLVNRFSLAMKLEMTGLKTAARDYLKRDYDSLIDQVLEEFYYREIVSAKKERHMLIE